MQTDTVILELINKTKAGKLRWRISENSEVKFETIINKDLLEISLNNTLIISGIPIGGCNNLIGLIIDMAVDENSNRVLEALKEY